MKKAQVFSPDFVVASVIFLLILSILQVYTQNVYDKIERHDNLLYYENLISTTDILMLYRGYPDNWNETNVEVMGLAGRPNCINRSKLESMMSMTDQKIKELMNIEGRSFNITVSNETGMAYTKGSMDWSDAENIFIINRNGLMEGEPVSFKFIVW